jgi:hypothetical protein
VEGAACRVGVDEETDTTVFGLSSGKAAPSKSFPGMLVCWPCFALQRLAPLGLPMRAKPTLQAAPRPASPSRVTRALRVRRGLARSRAACEIAMA